jgi:carbonic anhydrase
VVTCSDSPIPPEILFDQGLGDLFVVRTAGEVVGLLEIGTIEYAIEQLHPGLILVLGHERCGTVDATIRGGELPLAIAAVAAKIQPAVELAYRQRGDLLDNAIRENAKAVAAEIARSPIVAAAIKKGQLAIRVAYQDLDHGEVTELHY